MLGLFLGKDVLGKCSYLVADDAVCLLVEEDGYREPARVIRVIGEVDLSEVRVLRVQRVWNGVLAR